MRPPGTIQASAVGVIRAGSRASQWGILWWSAGASLMITASHGSLAIRNQVLDDLRCTIAWDRIRTGDRRWYSTTPG
jgi:hypothetical protein